MEIKNYLFKGNPNIQKDYYTKNITKRNKNDTFNKGSYFSKKQESSSSIFANQYIKKNNCLSNNKTNSSNNINMNSNSNYTINYQSLSNEKSQIAQKKSGKVLNSNSRNLSQTGKMSLNSKKKFLSSASNTATTSLVTNQMNNFYKCITERNYEENKSINSNFNYNKNVCYVPQHFMKNKAILINRESKDSSIANIPKKVNVCKKENISNNIGKNIIKNKVQKKESKYLLNYIDTNSSNNNMNENILFKKKIKNFKNSNSKLNNNKIKTQNINLNENKNKNNNNALNVKKLNISNMPVNFLDGKLIQGIMSLNANNTNNTNNTNINNNMDTSIKKECYTDRTNYNYINIINSHQKNKEIINEHYNNINNNYIIANIINNIKLNNKKVIKKKISRNKSIKLSDKNNSIYNSNLTSMNFILKNSYIKNNPSSLKIRTIDLSKINNNKTPSNDYNTSLNKITVNENKIANKKIFEVNKRKVSNTKKKNCNLKTKKKGKNYKKLINVPLKLTKKHIIPKEKKFNMDVHFSNNTAGFNKLNLLSFNYIHSFNSNQKTNNSLTNKRKLSQGNYSDRYRNIFQLFNNNKNSINESKRDSNNYNKTNSISNIIKTNAVRNIPKNSNNNINSLSNHDINNNIANSKGSGQKKDHLLRVSNNRKISENIKKIVKKNNSNSPFNIDNLLKKGNTKKNNDNSLHLKSRNTSRNYKNNYLAILSNESKTYISKYKTTNSNCSKNAKNEIIEKNNNNNNKNNISHISQISKKRLKNLSVAVNVINTSENNNKEKETSKCFSYNNIFYTEKNNTKNAKLEKSNEHKLISIKKNAKNNITNQNINNISSTITSKEKDKSPHHSFLSNKSNKSDRNTDMPINNIFKEQKINDDMNKNEKRKNPLIVDEYFDEILYSLLKEESEFITKQLINHNYLLDGDNEISPEMRAMVVDWLLEVHQIFHFQEKCLFTTIQLIDKYLTKININIDQFQLLALTALNIASKEEEVEYPILDNFITISKNSLTKKEMIDMEKKVLSIINYEILSPTILDFFQIYANICKLNPVEICQALYIMNILLIDINMLKYKVSILAFAVLKIIAKEQNIQKLIIFIQEISKNAYKANGNKNNEAQILLDEICKENKNGDLCKEIRYLFRTILKTHYHNAKNKFNNQVFYGVSSYTSI